MSEKVIVLGGSGMLGSMTADYLSTLPDLEVTATVRSQALADKCRQRLPEVSWQLFDGDAPDLDAALAVIDGHGWVINAIGITKPLIHDDNAIEIEQAVRINSLLPHLIAERAKGCDARVLQIATDCVFSGGKGEYSEDDVHDALDVYGKTKSLGEVFAPQYYHLRCSIVGPEPKGHKFLLDWFLGQSQNAGVGGYTNHRWNGITTLQFARLCSGIITSNISLPHIQHVIPTGVVTKCELLECFARSYGREDVTITPTEAGKVVDRTLKTADAAVNRDLWTAAGYSEPPSVPKMVAELASYNYRVVGL